MQATKLSSKALLVKLTIKRAALTRKDQALTDQIQAQQNDQSLTVLTKLFRDKNSPVYQVMQKVSEVYGYHKDNTLPWVDSGPRLLPSAQYMDYTAEMRHRIAVVDNMLNQWMPQYDMLVDADIKYRNGGQLTGRASVDDYPTASEFRQRMSFDLRFQPMPDQSHFLFDLSEDDTKAFDDAIHEAARLAKADAIGRMLDPLKHLVKKLSTPIDTDGSIFRDSAIENIVEGCKAARRLMLDDTPDLKAEIDQLENMATSYVFGADSLRNSPDTREAAAKRLAEVADKMAAFF